MRLLFAVDGRPWVGNKNRPIGSGRDLRATQSKKLHEIQDMLQELAPKDLNEMAAARHPTVQHSSAHCHWNLFHCAETQKDGDPSCHG